MEKINNYTPGPWEFVKGDSNHNSDRYIGGVRDCKDEYWIAAVENDFDTKDGYEGGAVYLLCEQTIKECEL